MKIIQSSLFDEILSDVQPILLISLRDDIHTKILLGKKLFEYRRVFIKESAKVYIYVTGQIKSICAVAEFGKPIIGSLDKMISVNSNEPNPNPNGILEYFKGSKNAMRSQ